MQSELDSFDQTPPSKWLKNMEKVMPRPCAEDCTSSLWSSNVSTLQIPSWVLSSAWPSHW